MHTYFGEYIADNSKNYTDEFLVVPFSTIFTRLSPLKASKYDGTP